MRIRLLREAGGLGDCLRAFAVATAIKERHAAASVWFYAMEDYVWHANLCPDIDVVVSVSKQERRDRDEFPDPAKHSYLASDKPFDATIDLYCPAWVYERSNPESVALDRTTVFTQAASAATGMDLEPCVARMNLPADAHERALVWLGTRGLHPKNDRSRLLVGVQPRGTHQVRRMTDEMAGNVIEELKGRGVDVVLFDMNAHPVREIAKKHGVHDATNLGNSLLYGLMSELDCMLTADSGLYHLAAVLGIPATAVVGCTGGEYLSRIYPLGGYIEPGEKEHAGLECSKPCYFVSCRRQRTTCNDKGCIAMMRLDTKAIVDKALAPVVVPSLLEAHSQHSRMLVSER